MRGKRVQSGLSLVELLVVLAIIGILSALAIVNYMNAMTRARQKRTAADIRNIAMAWEARATDVHRYSIAGAEFTWYDEPLESGELGAVLIPTYTKTMPRNDAWSRPLEFALETDAMGVANSYGIRSAGKDGVYETQPYTAGPKQDADCDIVYSAGGFVCYPDVITTERR